jgi:ubiquinone biosynthesis protein UbiJ
MRRPPFLPPGAYAALLALIVALEAIAHHDPDGRVQEAATKAIDAIRSNSPTPVELTRLREELDRLKKANDTLQERLDRFERKR